MKFVPSAETMKKIAKAAGVTTLGGAGVVALPIAVSALRNNRRAEGDASFASTPSEELMKPIPQVLESPPVPPVVDADTLMYQPKVEGAFAKRYLNEKLGKDMGPDVSTPNLMRPDGSNAITGSVQPVEDLNPPQRYR